jgi:hypothetical protein
VTVAACGDRGTGFECTARGEASGPALRPSVSLLQGEVPPAARRLARRDVLSPEQQTNLAQADMSSGLRKQPLVTAQGGLSCDSTAKRTYRLVVDIYACGVYVGDQEPILACTLN